MLINIMMKKEKTESILETAGRMFARYGLKKTSIDEMARLARVAKATIYNYFDSKDRVYLEVLKKEVDELIDKISISVFREKLTEKKLAVYGKARFQYMKRALNIINLEREGLEKKPPGAGIIRKNLFEREVRLIRSILNEGMEKGLFHLNDVSLAARAICHAFKGFEQEELFQEHNEKINNYLDELIRIIFSGLMSKNRC